MTRKPGVGDSRYRSLAERVNEFLDAKEISDDFAKECMWKLLEREKEHAAGIKRAATTMVVFVALFELLNRNLVDQASGFGVKLARLDFLITVIPVAVAYLFLRVASMSLARTKVKEAVYGISRKRFPALYLSDIDGLLLADPRPATIDVPSSFFRGTMTRTFVNFAGAAEAILIGSAVIAFEIYASFQLFHRYGIENIAAWLSLLVSLILLIGALPYLFAAAEK